MNYSLESKTKKIKICVGKKNIGRIVPFHIYIEKGRIIMYNNSTRFCFHFIFHFNIICNRNLNEYKTGVKIFLLS